MENAGTVGVKSGARDEVEGTAKKLIGTVEQGSGKVLHSEKLEGRGSRKKAEGIVQAKVGEIKRVLGG